MQLLAHDVLDTASSSSAHGLVFAHGILGSRNNWRSFARRVHEADPRWRIVLVDLRNIYKPEDVRALGFRYASVGRA